MTNDMIKEFPMVSIITVNFNQHVVTGELLKSIEAISYPNIEIIVVDNGSETLFSSSIDSTYSNLKIIRSDKNLGFAGGNNLGISVSKGAYLFFVNNDTELPKNCLEPLVECFISDIRIGIVSPKIKFYSNKNIIQYAGFSKMNPYTARNYGIGYLEEDNGQYDVRRETFYAHGAAMMIKKEIIAIVGPMPENFFLYYEELDWCEQIKRAGYKIIYEPKSEIFHKESMSVGKNSVMKTYYLTRNRILFVKRNFTRYHFLIFLLNFVFLSIPKNTLQFLVRFEFKHLKAFAKGILWNMNSLKASKLS